MSAKEKIKKLLPPPFVKLVGMVLNLPVRHRSNLYDAAFKSILSGEVLVEPGNLSGEYWLDVRSHLVRRLVLKGNYEPEVAVALLKYLKGDFVDVGANVGFFSIHVASNAPADCKVLAIEPNSKALSYLKRNTARNSLSETIVVEDCAVSDTAGEIVMNTYEGMEEYTSISEQQHPSVQEKKALQFKVKTVTLDELVKRHGIAPGLIKIDAEGAELQVLLGMGNILAKFKPAVICEIGGNTFGADNSALINFIEKNQYALFDLSGEPLTLDKDFGGEILMLPETTVS